MKKTIWSSTEDRDLSLSIIKDNSFATVISIVDSTAEITHLPLLAIHDVVENVDQLVLVGHAALKNPLHPSFKQGGTISAVFHGPHHYISPSWYERGGIPTWNFIKIHCEGEGEIIEYSEAEKFIDAMVNKYESYYGGGWGKSSISEKELEGALTSIFHFTIKVSFVDCRVRLSKNKDDKTREEIVNKLSTIGTNSSKEIAHYIGS